MNHPQALFSPPENFAGLSSPFSDFESAKVIILPVPYDSTTEWHSGTREGPAAIVKASQFLEHYDLESNREVYKVGIHTLPALKPAYDSAEDMILRVYKATNWLIQESKFMVMLGGEHSISLGAVQAMKKKYQDCSVLQLDAHADLRDIYTNTRYSHACVMRRIVELCPITQVGIRSLSIEEIHFLQNNNMKPFYLKSPNPGLLSVQQIIDSLSDHVYVTIDLDVFDPSIMPAVGTPEPGGLSWYEVINLLIAVARSKSVIGFDIVELCPQQGTDACAFLAAKLAYTFIGHTVY